jgi:hypothetical protein
MEFAVCAILLAAPVQLAEVCRSAVDSKCEGAAREFPSDVGSVAFVTTLLPPPSSGGPTPALSLKAGQRKPRLGGAAYTEDN